MTKNKLPKIKHTLYELVLPSSGEKYFYRQFTSREEKILLTAKEDNDVNQAILAMKQVVNNCVEGIDVDKLAMFDLEYIIILLRSKSVDNRVEFAVTDPDTKETVELELDLSEVKIVTNEKHSKEVKINDELTLFMRYPSITEFVMLFRDGAKDDDTISAQTTYEIMRNCMDTVVTGDGEVYKFNDFSEEEIEDFLNDLTAEHRKKISDFFETMPKLRHEVKYTNKDGQEKAIAVEGIRSFFI
jgi:hypothetical protein